MPLVQKCNFVNGFVAGRTKVINMASSDENFVRMTAFPFQCWTCTFQHGHMNHGQRPRAPTLSIYNENISLSNITRRRNSNDRGGHMSSWSFQNSGPELDLSTMTSYYHVSWCDVRNVWWDFGLWWAAYCRRYASNAAVYGINVRLIQTRHRRECGPAILTVWRSQFISCCTRAH